jgi:hypothetical protein
MILLTAEHVFGDQWRAEPIDLIQQMGHRLPEMEQPAGPSPRLKALAQDSNQPLPFHRHVTLQKSDRKALRPRKEPEERNKLRSESRLGLQGFKGLRRSGGIAGIEGIFERLGRQFHLHRPSRHEM